MEAKDITKKTIHDYLNFRGVREAMIFGNENDCVDPIDRHVFLRDMYERFTGYRMERDGLTLHDKTYPNTRIVISNMTDFDGITTIDECVINLKFLSYSKEHYVKQARLRQSRDSQEPEVER